MAIKDEKWPVIRTDVPPDLKNDYTKTWKRLGFASEAEFSRHLYRKAIIENKEKPE